MANLFSAGGYLLKKENGQSLLVPNSAKYQALHDFIIMLVL